MEETLKQILEQLNSLNSKVDTMGSDIKEVKGRVDSLENKLDKLETTVTSLDKREQKHFELLMEEQNRIFLSLDGKLDNVLDRLAGHEVRISALEV